MQTKSLISSLALSACLAACGGGNEQPSMSEAGAGAISDATQSEAKAAPVSCPPEISNPASSFDGPVDDILGIKPGMSLEDVSEILACHNQSFTAEFDDNFFARPVGMSMEAREVAHYTDFERCSEYDLLGRDCREPRSREHIRLALTGFEGEEQVVGIWRMRGWDMGEEPTMEAILSGLTGKYGEPTEVKNSGSRRMITWAFDPRGRLIKDTSYSGPGCHRNVSARMLDGSSFETQCGSTIEVYISGGLENDLLVSALHIASLNQADLVRARTAFEEEYAARDAARQAEEAASSQTEVDL